MKSLQEDQPKSTIKGSAIEKSSQVSYKKFSLEPTQ